MRQHTPEAVQQARVIYDVAARILGKHPKSIIEEDTFEPPKHVDDFLSVVLAAPLNPRLLAVYDQVSDRLALIHTCLNAHRLRNGQANKHMPYWGNTPQRKDWLSSPQLPW